MASLLCHLHFWTLKALSPRTATGELQCSGLVVRSQAEKVDDVIYFVFFLLQAVILEPTYTMRKVPVSCVL